MRDNFQTTTHLSHERTLCSTLDKCIQSDDHSFNATPDRRLIKGKKILSSGMWSARDQYLYILTFIGLYLPFWAALLTQ